MLLKIQLSFRKEQNINTLTLDDEGHIVEARNYNNRDSITGSTINVYSPEGNLIKQTTETLSPYSSSVWEYKNLKFDTHDNMVFYNTIIDGGKYKLCTERIFVYY